MEKKKIALLVSVVGLFGFLIYQKNFVLAIPTLKEGTYLTGQTLSVWPSWSVLGSALGQALPVDPINQLGPAGTCVSSTNKFCLTDANCLPVDGAKCVLHDRTTGWSTADRRFSFACNRESYAYRYIVDSSTNSYTVRAHFEDTGLSTTNFSDFVGDFVSTTIVKIDQGGGVCNFNEEISTIESGRCGDGKLNMQRGEQCDPPGRIEYQADCNSNQLRSLTVCNSSCQWVVSTTPCNSLSKCGNGRKEAGEVCDEGGLNGRYNHCNNTCSGRSGEFCGNGLVSSTYEICDPGTPGREKYSPVEKNQSCSWDCQNWGPYCGDKIVQTEHGETCDGSQTCTIGGRQGLQVCDNCQRQDKDALAWWPLETLGPSAVPNVLSARDVSMFASNHGLCKEGECPTVVAGKIGKALGFSVPGVNKEVALRVSPSQDFEIKESITVEAWVNPSDYENLYQRVVEQGGTQNKTGFDLELNASSTKHTARFNVWNGNPTGVDSESSIPLNIWTHIVATYERSGDTHTLRLYINGLLESTNSFTSSEMVMDRPQGDLFIGKSGFDGGSNFFFGSLDEIKIYNRALSADEVRNSYQTGWLCQVGATPPQVPGAENIPSSCGNGVVDANEACDRGAGNNGQACTASYGHPCSYCAANCQNIVDVQPVEYCGNGIIEQREKCDTVSPAGTIYASATNTDRTTLNIKDQAHNGYQELACSAEPYIAHTLNKGTKTCGDCLAGVTRNCIRCGIDENGVSVSGGIINVLATSTGLQDPLFTNDLARAGVMAIPVSGQVLDRRASSSLRLAIGACRNSSDPQHFGDNVCDSIGASSPLVGQLRKGKNEQGLDFKSYTLLNPYGAGNALVNSNQACSQGDSSQRYSLYLNNDWTRPLGFSVVAQPQPWQYDLVLSPIIDNTVRNKDLRVVVSWVAGEFYGGVLNPFADNPEISGPSYCNPPAACAVGQKKYATGVKYYNTPDSQLFGVWYHGFNSTNGHTEAESFTINTANMSGNTYSFFVRSPSSPIRQFKNTARLKVEIFLPESPYNPSGDQFLTGEDPYFNFPFRFGLPAKTYYFNTALPSDNPSAKYWHVFNINKPSIANPVSSTDILDVNTIFTGPAQFKYTQPLIRDNNPIQDPNSDIVTGGGQGGPVQPLPFDPPPDQVH